MAEIATVLFLALARHLATISIPIDPDGMYFEPLPLWLEARDGRS